MQRPLIDVFAGDDVVVPLTVYQPGTTTPQNVTGWSFILYVKWNPKDPDNKAVFWVAGVITDAAAGIVSFTLTPTQTATIQGTAMYIVRALDGLSAHHTVVTGPYRGRIS